MGMMTFEEMSKAIKNVIQNNYAFSETLDFIMREISYSTDAESEAVFACIEMIETMFEDYRQAREEEEEEENEDY